MLDLLVILHPWIKSLHIMAVIAWMAGLFYLPRLFVYHVEKQHHETFQAMEAGLLRTIMNPSMIVTWGAGLSLAAIPGVVDFSSVWPWLKFSGVLAMTLFHGWCAAERKRLLLGIMRSGRTYRIINEAPTLLMIIIVLAVVVKF